MAARKRRATVFRTRNLCCATEARTQEDITHLQTVNIADEINLFGATGRRQMTAELLESDGTRTVQLSDKDGLVLMHFEKPVRWVALDPATAGALAESMAKAAYKVYSGDVPAEGTKQLTEGLPITCKNH